MRQQVQVRLSPEARRGFDRLVTEHGTTLTSVLEVVGLELAAGRMPLPAKVLADARKIDLQRRSRR